MINKHMKRCSVPPAAEKCKPKLQRRRCARGPASDPFRDSGSLEGTLGSREHRKRPTFPAPCPSLPRDSIPSVFLWSPESFSFWTSLCTSAVERPKWCLLTSARPVPGPRAAPHCSQPAGPAAGSLPLRPGHSWSRVPPRGCGRSGGLAESTARTLRVPRGPQVLPEV